MKWKRKVWCCTISQKCIARSNFFFSTSVTLERSEVRPKAKIKFIDLLKTERFNFVLFLRKSLRFKVTEVQKNGARNTLMTAST